MKKFYALANTLVIAGVIFWNYYSNTGAVNDKTVGSISDDLYNLFTPAGYAFAIWGLIFLSLLLFGIHQIRLAFFNGDHSDTIEQVGPWLLIANLGNAAWVYFWLTEQTGISVLVMLVILLALLKCVINLNMQLEPASLMKKAFVWWPIALYSGWITVATIANIAAYLAKMNWEWLLNEAQWTLAMIAIAATLNLVVLYKRRMPVFAGVCVWALVAIALRHKEEYIALYYIALMWAVFLAIAIIVSLIKKPPSIAR